MSSTILNTSGTDTDSQVKICNFGICLTSAAMERNRLAQVGDDNHPRRLANAILAGLSKGYDLPLLCYYAESYWEYLPAGHPAGPVWVAAPLQARNPRPAAERRGRPVLRGCTRAVP